MGAKQKTGRVFFTSDTHFGHGNIIKYSKRPFLCELDQEELARIGQWHDGNWKGDGASDWRISPESIELMDEALLRQINDTVGEHDVLWHLGDFAMPGRNHNHYYRTRYYRDSIKCRTVNLIWGNHDDRRTTDIFNETYDLKEVEVPGLPRNAVLCHYAMAVWNKSHRGNMHFYGHSHSEAEPWLNRSMVGRRSMDVGVDNAAKVLGKYRPFSTDDIMALIGSQVGFAFDHHVGKMANTPTEEVLN
jgi:calcineurin-like phosphoesterase family protein